MSFNSKNDVELSVSDIEIGAVEAKDASTDNRADINDANTARTTATHVLAVQQIAADGTVPPSGSSSATASYVHLTDGTNDNTLVDIGTTYGVGVGIFDASGRRMPSMDSIGYEGYMILSDGLSMIDFVSAGVGASAIPVAHVDANGNRMPTGDDAARSIHVTQDNLSFNSGAADATTVRAILATDDPAVLLLTAIDVDTSSLAGCVAGSEVQVDIVSMPAITGSVTADTELPPAALLADDTAIPTAPAVGAFMMVYDGATFDMLRGDSTNGMLVNLGSNNDITMAVLPDTAAGDLASINTLAATIDADTSALAGCVGGSELQVDVVSSALPSGAATEATLAGVALESGGNLDTIAGDTTSLDTKVPAQGQAAMAASVPVVIASDQSAVPTSVASLPLPSGAATEATLSTIDADTSALAGCVGGSELQVDIVSSALPSGAATEASLSSIDGKITACNTGAIVGDVTSNSQNIATEATLSAIDADTSALSGCVAGNEVQVDVVASLPVGDNNIGNVDIVTLPASSAFSVDNSAALEASSVSKASAGRFYSISGRIDSTAASDDYFIQIIDAAAVPADGAVTLLVIPLKIVHTNGTDSYFDIDVTGNDLYSGVAAGTGIVWCVSTTEFTKTIAGNVASATLLYA